MRNRVKLIVAVMSVCLLWSLTAEGITLQNGGFRIVTSKTEDAPVMMAVNSLVRDFQKVSGYNVDVVNEMPADDLVNIVVVNASDAKSLIKPSYLRPLDDFESHRVYVDSKTNRIYLYGKDMRGTIYAIYTFSEEILGVPPLWFFCDWKPQKRKLISVPDSLDIFYKTPQVRYRAWFPNDQDLFAPWRKLSNANDKTWYETMLRLKLNTVELEATVGYPDYRIKQSAKLLKRFGLICTSHHHVVCNNNFANWEGYWEQERKIAPPELLLANEDKIIEFWRYSIETVQKNNIENLWQVGFRGRGDRPYWSAFKDAPESEKERAEVINRMIRIQYELIREITGEDKPFVRMTFYDEISDLLAKGYLKPIVGDNILWTFVAGRRDHYPYDDLVSFDPAIPVNLGYYMNLQFTSTGAHLAPAEGPWKTEFNYRYVNSKKPLLFSVVNVGNLREFVMEMSANAKMMWDMDAYDTDCFLLDFCEQYFGKKHAQDVFKLYNDYYWAYWLPKPSEFQGLDRQFIFQDNRYARVFNQLEKNFAANKYNPNPLREIGFERIKGRSFRIAGESQVDSIIAGTLVSGQKFHKVALEAEQLSKKLPKQYRQFFYDNLWSYALYMAEMNDALHLYVKAYKEAEHRLELIRESRTHLLAAREALLKSQHGVFNTWYSTEKIIGFDKILSGMDKIEKASLK